MRIWAWETRKLSGVTITEVDKNMRTETLEDNNKEFHVIDLFYWLEFFLF
jgi:hypothetical protein